MHKERLRKPVFVVFMLVFTLAAAACGGATRQDTARQGDRAEQQADRTGESDEGGRRIHIGSGEFYFDPEDVVVQRGETVTLVVANDGALAHNISIDEFDVDETYNVGQTIDVTFTPNQVGTYRIYCDEPGHTEAGMVGTLKVE